MGVLLGATWRAKNNCIKNHFQLRISVSTTHTVDTSSQLTIYRLVFFACYALRSPRLQQGDRMKQ
jgi:hypothetical protein